MSDDVYKAGYADTPYYTNKGIREEIDQALKECAILHTKTGTRQLKDENGRFIDDMGTDQAELWVKAQENKILGGVVDLDPSFVEPLMYSEDTFDFE